MSGDDPLVGQAGQGRNIVQLLALFLVLLSFFILLNSLSSFEAKRAQAVLGSVGETFAGRGRLEVNGPFAATGDRAALERLREALRQALLSAISTARLESGAGGRTMAIELGSDELFVHGSAELRPDRARLLRGLAAALAARPADLRFEIELTFGRGLQDDGMSLARAGSAARALVAMGAPADAIAVGMRDGQAEAVRLAFHVRKARDGRLDLAPVVDELGSVP